MRFRNVFKLDIVLSKVAFQRLETWSILSRGSRTTSVRGKTDKFEFLAKLWPPNSTLTPLLTAFKIIKVRRGVELVTSANESADKHWNYFRSKLFQSRSNVVTLCPKFPEVATLHPLIWPGENPLAGTETITIIRLFSLLLTKFPSCQALCRGSIQATPRDTVSPVDELWKRNSLPSRDFALSIDFLSTRCEGKNLIRRFEVQGDYASSLLNDTRGKKFASLARWLRIRVPWGKLDSE